MGNRFVPTLLLYVCVSGCSGAGDPTVPRESQISDVSAIEAVLYNQTDTELDAITRRLEEILSEADARYLWELDWSRYSEVLLSDPTFVAALGSMSDFGSRQKNAADCDESEPSDLRERFQWNCRGVQAVRLELSPMGQNQFVRSVGASMLSAVRSTALDCDVPIDEVVGATRSGGDGGSDYADPELRDRVSNGPGACYENDCVEIFEEIRGNQCGEPDSMQIKFRNKCGYRIAVGYCFKRDGREDDCGVTRLDPAEEHLYGAWTCRGTGEYTILAAAESVYDAGGCRLVSQ